MIGSRSSTLSTAVLALALIAGCAGSPEPQEPEPPAASDRISMSRGPCFGACPIYTVTVWGDGRVRFEGDRFVEQTGEHTKTVDPEAVAALFAAADSFGFHRLPSDITPANQQACGSSWTDMPSAEITIVRAGRGIHTVNHYHGCPKAPEALTRFENRIDAVAGIAEWIGG